MTTLRAWAVKRFSWRNAGASVIVNGIEYVPAHVAQKALDERCALVKKWKRERQRRKEADARSRPKVIQEREYYDPPSMF